MQIDTNNLVATRAAVCRKLAEARDAEILHNKLTLDLARLAYAAIGRAEDLEGALVCIRGTYGLT